MEDSKSGLSFSFACGGWLQFYLFGVAKAIQEHGLHRGQTKLIGCSAGNFIIIVVVSLLTCAVKVHWLRLAWHAKVISIKQSNFARPIAFHLYTIDYWEFSNCMSMCLHVWTMQLI